MKENVVPSIDTRHNETKTDSVAVKTATNMMYETRVFINPPKIYFGTVRLLIIKLDFDCKCTVFIPWY